MIIHIPSFIIWSFQSVTIKSVTIKIKSSKFFLFLSRNSIHSSKHKFIIREIQEILLLKASYTYLGNKFVICNQIYFSTFMNELFFRWFLIVLHTDFANFPVFVTKICFSFLLTKDWCQYHCFRLVRKELHFQIALRNFGWKHWYSGIL